MGRTNPHNVNRSMTSDWRNSSASSRTSIPVLTAVCLANTGRIMWQGPRLSSLSWTCSISSINDYVRTSGISSRWLARTTKMTLRSRWVSTTNFIYCTYVTPWHPQQQHQILSVLIDIDLYDTSLFLTILSQVDGQIWWCSGAIAFQIWP